MAGTSFVPEHEIRKAIVSESQIALLAGYQRRNPGG
jgi:hypothetical protein